MTLSNYHMYSTSKAAWDAMYQAICAAQESIYWQLYMFVDDDTGFDFFDVLEQKARDGVEVKIIVDWWGSFGLSRKRIDSLRQAGVDVQLFHARRHRYRGLWKVLTTRNHRKVLVVDKRIGFIGGVNICKGMEDWLDIQLRLEGKVVRSMIRSFVGTYLICGGKKSSVRHLREYCTPMRHRALQYIFDDGHTRKSTARTQYVDALRLAKKRVIFFSPYYFPDKQFLQSLWQARKRGVKVDLLIPWRSDIRFLTYAAYAWFGTLTKIGVNVHVLKKMMHGKGVIVDDEWAMIGSSNLTQDSFFHHYEANVRFSDKRLVKALTKTVKEWLTLSESVSRAQWEKRGRWQRIKEWCCLHLYRFWHRRNGWLFSKKKHRL